MLVQRLGDGFRAVRFPLRLRGPGDIRFSMLRSIHDLASERLANDGAHDGVARRFAEHLAALGETAEPHLETGNQAI